MLQTEKHTSENKAKFSSRRKAVELAILLNHLTPEEEIYTIDDLQNELINRSRAEQLKHDLIFDQDSDNLHLKNRSIPVLDLNRIKIVSKSEKSLKRWESFVYAILIIGLIIV